jgi:hypothetical protein
MQIDAETFILAAGRHGENAGDGDLEAGDLQERIRAARVLFSSRQATAFAGIMT